jgi:GntR family transcriptional regulator
MPRRPNIAPKDFPRPPTREYEGTRADAARWVRDVLRGQILEGAFGGLAAARPPLPSESELAAQLGVSRNAIREALKLLRAEGLITRVQGSGTFVTGAKLRQHLDRLEGLAESLAGHRLPVDNEVLSVRESTASHFVADKLQLPENAPILFIERLRSVGGLPLSLDTTSLRMGAVSVDTDLDRADVFALIEETLGVQLGWAEITVESVSADPSTATFLQIRPGAPLLLLHRLTYLEDGTPFDLETVRYRGDRCTLVTNTPRGTANRPP